LLRGTIAVAVAVIAVSFVSAAQAEEMIVALRVNGQLRGDALIDTQTDGSAWLGADEAAKLGFTSARLETLKGNDGRFRLSTQSDLRTQLNMETLALEVTASPDWFARNTLSLSTRGGVTISELAGVHGWLNYAVSLQGARGSALAGAVEANAILAYGPWTLQSEQAASIRSASNLIFNRTRSSLAFDDLKGLTRVTIGDVSPAVGVGSTASRLLGVQWARRYEFDPSIATQPTFALTGQALTPSTVDVFVDGIRVRTFSVAPGWFDLRDLSYFSGLRNVDIVVRDRAGVESRSTLPYYFATEMLAANRDTFDLSAGTNQGAATAKPWVVALNYRRGINDYFTLGGASELKAAYQTARIDAGFRHEALGTLFGTVAVSKATGNDIARYVSLAHNWSSGRLSSQIAATKQDPMFGVDADAPTFAKPVRQRLSANASVSLDHQRSVSFNFARSSYAVAAQDSVASLRVAQGWGRGSNVWMTVSRSMQDGQRASAIALGVSIPIGDRWSVSATHAAQSGTPGTTNLRAARSDGDDGWTNLRLAAEHRATGSTLDGFIQHPLPFGIVSLSGRAEQYGSTTDLSGEARLAGAVAWAEGRAWTAPPIAQAFAIVDSAGIAGVRVMHNNQLVGRTNGEGQLLLPNLAAYAANQVRIDDRDIPLEIELAAVQQDVSPRLNAGAKVKFAGKRVAAVAGTLRVDDSSGIQSLVTAARLTVTNGNNTVVSSTDDQGGFYLENLQPGTWTLSALNRKTTCVAVITLPDPLPSFIDAGVLPCIQN